MAKPIDRRRTSADLAAGETRLAETVEDLRSKERAMDEAPIGITITGPEAEATTPSSTRTNGSNR